MLAISALPDEIVISHVVVPLPNSKDLSPVAPSGVLSFKNSHFPELPPNLNINALLYSVICFLSLENVAL